MGKYEELVNKYKDLNIIETDMLPSFQSGMYFNNKIYINSNRSEAVKLETLAEELAHHKLTYGNITDQSQFNNRKFEGYARRYAMEQLVSLEGIIDAFKNGCHNLYEIANFFEVSAGYVQNCLAHYKRKYGLSTLCGDYLIRFEPLGVFEYKNIN
ncbi:ImmA/IrrE family metallo-endopeptidase [Staphylococcus kloosii]|jgi:Zn-dependent peptidase ImmA (M78 family)|uniref:ImmA/IrrE family metallo-endopeptidase n=1 Tax=Staphylococcus kloosii TaxID=29384 RepID=UPI00189DEDB3|nr:ImmA/IrrE family metallo-endopeptidase [Staphylococcus kloosii]MBF7022529.1 ImmA/IrrE family metallo-endopeptidase [Staphylococcus kloosii]MCD8878245.1 ImmA/IrrE family metallo-endopeptidase [Staphylococcus kloosii]